MASQVLSGTNTNLTYTNSTGQNVRVVINYLRFPTSGSTLIAGNMTLTNVGISAAGIRQLVIGKNVPIGTISDAISGDSTSVSPQHQISTEYMLSSGQVFSVSGSCTFNVVVIPEAG